MIELAGRKDTMRTLKCVKTFLRQRLPASSRPSLFGVD
jgi:hypothetical protein